VQGNINLMEAAADKGVKKFVLVTSIGTGNSKEAPPPNVYEVLKPVLLEKEKAEERLKVWPNLAHLAGYMFGLRELLQKLL
jgi:nucleoside-diphosphate-sugar epimerase